jgi:hypothetical protein
MAYPSFPLDKISIDELLQKLTHETLEWVRSRPTELNVNLEGILKEALTNLGIERKQPSLAAQLEGTAIPKRNVLAPEL